MFKHSHTEHTKRQRGCEDVSHGYQLKPPQDELRDHASTADTETTRAITLTDARAAAGSPQSTSEPSANLSTQGRGHTHPGGGVRQTACFPGGTPAGALLEGHPPTLSAGSHSSTGTG